MLPNNIIPPPIHFIPYGVGARLRQASPGVQHFHFPIVGCSTTKHIPIFEPVRTPLQKRAFTGKRRATMGTKIFFWLNETKSNNCCLYTRIAQTHRLKVEKQRNNGHKNLFSMLFGPQGTIVISMRTSLRRMV